LSGFAAGDVRRRLAALIGRPEDVAAKLLSGGPRTVKTGIDHATGLRYVETLKKIGVACHLEQEILELDLDAQHVGPPPPAVTTATSDKLVSPPPKRSAFAVREDARPVRKGRPGSSRVFAWVIAIGVVAGILSVMILTYRPASPDRSANNGTAATLTPEQQAQQERQRERDAQLEERKKHFAAQRSSLIARVKQLNSTGKYADAFQLGSQWLALDPELDAQTDIARDKVATQTERAEQARKKTSASHKSGICAHITRGVDLLLYDQLGHGSTTTCLYTDDWLLIKPNRDIGEERMSRFRFVSFIVVGSLRNDDFELPEQVYAGFGRECWAMKTNDAATSQRLVKLYHDDATAWMTIANLPKVACPNRR
jgi:hypothetical protein